MKEKLTKSNFRLVFYAFQDPPLCSTTRMTHLEYENGPEHGSEGEDHVVM
jgi:hypothetical protein